MSALIKIATPEFRITGDGVATDIILSLVDYPFPANPQGAVEAISYMSTDPNLSTITFTSSHVTLNFTSAFTGDAGPVQLFVSYKAS